MKKSKQKPQVFRVEAQELLLPVRSTIRRRAVLGLRALAWMFAAVSLTGGCTARGISKAGLTVLYSHDILGELENCGCDDNQLGSLARKARVLQIVRNEDAALLVLDGGNLFFRKTPINVLERREFLLKSHYILQAYNHMGCDALNIGNMDLALGLDVLRELEKQATFPFMSCNLVDRVSGEPLFKRELVLKSGGLRLGIVGLFPGDGRVPDSLRVLDPVAAARDTVYALRGRCDIIIVLSSLGLAQDRLLAGRVPGIDIIVSGRAEELLPEAVIEGGTTIIGAYRRGQYQGRLDVRGERRNKGWKLTFENRLIPLNEEIGDDVDIAAMVKQYRASMVAMNKQDFFKKNADDHSAVSGQGRYAGARVCMECHLPQYEIWQTTFHARAYQTLLQEERNYDIECLACHTTGYGEAGGYAASDDRESLLLNVQCEACHGPGGDHPGQGSLLRHPGREVCTGCHDEKNSPDFDYESYVPMVQCPVF